MIAISTNNWCFFFFGAFAVGAFKLAVCLCSHLLLGRSSLPFAMLQMLKMLRGSFDQPSNRQNTSRELRPGTSQACVVRAWKPAVCMHSRLLLGSSKACRLPGVKCLKCSAATSTSLPTDQKCFAAASTRHFGPGHLLLERSSLPFACIAACC